MQNEKKLLIGNEILGSCKRQTPNQLKAFYFILYKFKIENIFSTTNGEYNGETEITINIEEFMPIYKHKKISQQNIMSLINDMEIYLYFYDNGRVTAIPMFLEISHKYNGENITFKLNKELIPSLIETENNFSEIALNNLFKLNKKYSNIIYEMYCRFKNQKNYKIPLDKMKYIFEYSDKYSSAEMERAVLNTGIKEIKEKIGVNITYKKEKKNGKITHYIFKFN